MPSVPLIGEISRLSFLFCISQIGKRIISFSCMLGINMMRVKPNCPCNKGKPIERWGRKVSGLRIHFYDSGTAGKLHVESRQVPLLLGWKSAGIFGCERVLIVLRHPAIKRHRDIAPSW